MFYKGSKIFWLHKIGATPSQDSWKKPTPLFKQFQDTLFAHFNISKIRKFQITHNVSSFNWS